MAEPAEALRAQVQALRSQADALEALAERVERPADPQARTETPSEADESWRSRVHRVHPDTRLPLDEVAEVLACSERTVRRKIDGESEGPPLPADRGPAGLTVRAGELLRWIEEIEGGHRFRVASGGGG